MDIQKINNLQFKALTGITKQEFEKVFNGFYTSVLEEAEANYANRELIYSKYDMRFPRFEAPNEQMSVRNLFMTLTYLKNYPHFEVLGYYENMTGSNAKQIVDKGLVHLYKGLKILEVLPKREFKDSEELEEYLSNIEDILIDVTERRISRPKEEQEKAYSCKKKCHTVKNTVLTTTKKVILFLGYTVFGKKHDYGLFKEEFLELKEGLNSKSVWVDLGYIGIKKDFEIIDLKIPYKKPYKTKKNPEPKLTEEQKAYNKELSQTRILVEHAIGGMKIFRSLKDVFRNNFNMADQVILCCAGLWNLKLKKL